MFTGAVLVGGRSTRMGRDKAALFGPRVVAALETAGAAEVLLVGGADHPDERPGCGPLGGIATSLRLAHHDVVVVLACDMPDVRADSIRAVVAALEGSSADVALPPGEPLHAAWRRSARPAVLAALDQGKRAVRAALDGLRVVDVPGIDPGSLRNVNSPADLLQTDVMAAGGVPEIGIEELEARRRAGGFLLDVRRPDEYAEGHVPGAVLIPLDQLPVRWYEVPEGDVLVICRTGARSARAVQALNEAGRTATNVAGGTLAWIEAGHPIVTGDDPT